MVDFKLRPGRTRPVILWVGDAGVPSGFALSTHKIVNELDYRVNPEGKYEVAILGINYHGDPDVMKQYPYDIHPCMPGGDYIGVGRIVWACDRYKPDVIVLQNDPWNIPAYIQQLKLKKESGEYEWPEHAKIPVVGIIAVDGKNCRGNWLKGLDLAVFWTKFAMDEARAGGYLGPAAVVPLGVDREVFYPVDKRGALARLLLGQLSGKFIVGNVNRNQPRKRWDLTLEFFADWIHGGLPVEQRVESREKNTFVVNDAYLYLHVAPTGDMGIDVKQLASYYKVYSRIALHQPPMWKGVTTEELRDIYNVFDVLISTTQGEGFGLTTLEAMACETACIVPDWSALGEWAKSGAVLVPCTGTAVGPPYVGVVGGVPDRETFVEELARMYSDKKWRAEVAALGFKLSQEEKFNWKTVGMGFEYCLNFIFDKDSVRTEQTQHAVPAEEEEVKSA